MPIRHLPPSVVSAIAAGEVIERPADVIKELVENALDAQATQITIELENYGLDSLKVTDNGHGIPAAELPLALERHATSKVHTLTEFEAVTSFGFRGEALASLVSVADVVLASRPPGSAVGTQIRVTEGQLSTPHPQAMMPGTQVEVLGLFERQPARLKFLKKLSTELRRSVEIVTQLAIHHPHVGFSLYHQNKILLLVPAGQTAATRLTDVFGQTVTTKLHPLTFEAWPVKLQGWLGSPQLAKPHRRHHFLAVNHRPVSLPQLSQLCKEVYGSLLPPKLEPWLMLNIELPPQFLDVNTHPRKTTVRIMDDDTIWKTLRQALSDALHTPPQRYPTLPRPASLPLSLADSGPNWQPLPRLTSLHTRDQLQNVTLPWKFDSEQPPEIMQIDRTYLAVATPHGLSLFDQHAVHERILFEQYISQLNQLAGHATSATLSEPILIQLEPSYAQLLQDHLADLSQLGWEINEFGPHTFQVSQVPQLLLDHSIETVLHEVLHDIESGKPLVGLDSQAERTAAYLACHQAIKAGDFVAPAQRQELLLKLWQTPNHTTCPHGRPTQIEITIPELEKMFKRR